MSSEADRAVSDFNHKSIEEKRRLSSAYRIEKIGIAEGGAVGQWCAPASQAGRVFHVSWVLFQCSKKTIWPFDRCSWI